MGLRPKPVHKLWVLAALMHRTPIAFGETQDTHPAAGVTFGTKIAAQARNEVERFGDRYAVDSAVHIPWRDDGQPREHTRGQWKCNVFALNVVYAAGGRVPVVAYGPKLERIISNYMFWQGRRLSRHGRGKVAQSHYPFARELANPQLFVKTLPVVAGGLDALQEGDLVILKPPRDSPSGHCLVYLGKRQGNEIHAAYASSDGAVIEYYELEKERGYTIRRPRRAPAR
jgi:hypothetical protein